MRLRSERDDLENYNKSAVGSLLKDSSIGLVRIMCFLIVFVTGVVIGLASSSHVDRYFNLRADQLDVNRARASSYSGIGQNCTVVLRCKREDCLSMESFFTPTNLTHGLSDAELFWRASMVPSKAEYPYDRVPKVAFMFLTRGPLPLLPLWEKFFRGQDESKFSIYLHALPGFVLNVTDSSAFYRRQIPSQDVKWGTVSLVDAERRLLGNALLDFSNQRFVLLSESCIPVYNFPTIYKYLVGSSHSFIDSYDDPSRYGRGRYNRWMKPDVRLADWRKGSQWFEMNRTLAIKVVSDTKYYDLFKRYCTPACYPDEHYIPTFVNMFYGPLSANRTVTYVDWSLGGPHPASFEASNITEGLIRSIRNNGTFCSYNLRKTTVCFLFARKFRPSTLEPLLDLMPTVLRF